MKKDPGKHMVYYKLLDYFKSGHCPICSAEADAAWKYFEAVTGENWNDPKVRNALIRSKGYCRHHAQILLKAGHPLDRAILYQDQVNLFLEFLDSLEKNRASLHKPLENWSQHAVCPACEAEQAAAGRHVDVFLKNMHDPIFMEAFGTSAGLCVPHLLEILRSAPRDIPAALIETERAKMRELDGDLDAFIRKHDYRFSGEKFGREGNAWQRAVEMMKGFLDPDEHMKTASLTKPEKTIKGRFKAGQVREIHVVPESTKNKKDQS